MRLSSSFLYGRPTRASTSGVGSGVARGGGGASARAPPAPSAASGWSARGSGPSSMEVDSCKGSVEREQSQGSLTNALAR